MFKYLVCLLFMETWQGNTIFNYLFRFYQQKQSYL